MDIACREHSMSKGMDGAVEVLDSEDYRKSGAREEERGV